MSTPSRAPREPKLSRRVRNHSAPPARNSQERNSHEFRYDEVAAGPRLQKVLAAAGFGSRRLCEELIRAGRVTVDRQVVAELGARVDPAQQRIFVDGVPIQLKRKRYFLLCKPAGVVCTAYDPAGRTKAIDLLPKDFGRLFTVGRLDENSEGLLLVTNDGDLANRLAHPRFQVERRYRVLVAGQPTSKALEELKRGLYFTEGKFRVRDVRRIGNKGQSTILDVTLTEGQNREIRRLFARVGHKVMALVRIGFGPMDLRDLQPGEFRELSDREVKSLQDFASGKRSQPTSELRPAKQAAKRERPTPDAGRPRKATRPKGAS
jgi:23S rRNA pseudouridine2605 synthase